MPRSTAPTPPSSSRRSRWCCAWGGIRNGGGGGGRALLQAKTRIGEGSRYARAVPLSHPGLARHRVPARLHDGFRRIYDCACLFAREQEARALREDVVRLRVAARIPDTHRKVAALHAHRSKRSEIIRRRKAKVAIHRNHRVG